MPKIDTKSIEHLNELVVKVSHRKMICDEEADTDDYATLIVPTSSNLLKVFYVEEKPDEVAVLFVRLFKSVNSRISTKLILHVYYEVRQLNCLCS